MCRRRILIGSFQGCRQLMASYSRWLKSTFVSRPTVAFWSFHCSHLKDKIVTFNLQLEDFLYTWITFYGLLLPDSSYQLQIAPTETVCMRTECSKLKISCLWNNHPWYLPTCAQLNFSPFPTFFHPAPMFFESLSSSSAYLALNSINLIWYVWFIILPA